MVNLISYFKVIFRSITVEPIGFLSFVYAYILKYAGAIVHERAICQHEFGTDPMVDCLNLNENKRVQGLIQREAVDWVMYLTFASTIPGMLADTFLGAWGDVKGRKANMLIGSVGVLLSAVTLLVIYAVPTFPLWGAVLLALLSGCTGNLVIVTISCFAFLCDISTNEEHLTIHMSFLHTVTHAATAIGAALSGLILAHLSEGWLVMIGICFQVCAFLYALFRIPQLPPVIMKKVVKENWTRPASRRKITRFLLEAAKKRMIFWRKKGVVVNPKPPEAGTSQTAANPPPKSKGWLLPMVKMIFRLIRDSVKTCLKRREGHKRAFILITALSFLFTISAHTELSSVITTYYSFKRLNWTASDASYWRSFWSTLEIFGTLFGSLVFKKLLKCRDTALILIGCASLIGEILLVAFAVDDWMMYLGAVVGCLSILAFPGYKAFVCHLVNTDEVGKVFTIFPLGTSLSVVLSATIYNQIYRATESTFPEAVYLFAAGFMVVAWFLMLGVHVLAQMEESNARPSKKIAIFHTKRIDPTRLGKFKTTIKLGRSKDLGKELGVMSSE